MFSHSNSRLFSKHVFFAQQQGTAAAPAREHSFRIGATTPPDPDNFSKIPEEGDPGLLLRVVEILIAATALLLTGPIMALLWVVVRLDSPGPALFHQWRLGKGARPFRFVKFRTLYVDARQRFPHLYDYEYSADQLDNLYFKVAEDPRVTRFGRWLRKSTLDELPNFWHVLTGEMSLVGPRPEIPEMLRYYLGQDRLKFSVRPGVTGIAQISGRGRLNFRETVRYDLEYVRTRNWLLDVKILLRTLYGVVVRDGAF